MANVELHCCDLFVVYIINRLFSSWHPPQRVSVIKMSDDEIIELLAARGIHKRTPEEAEADEEFEPFEDHQDRQEL